MLRETEKNYTHVYLDLTDEIIYFHSTSVPCRLGKSLLDFIYMDLKKAFLQVETVREIHPYFSSWSDEGIQMLMAKTEDDETASGLTPGRMEELQNIYKNLLDALIHGTSEMNEEATHYFLRHPFYSSGTLVNQTVKNENRWIIDYFLMGFEDCLMCELVEMLRRHQIIKICKNCGRFFIPKRSNVDYCTRVFSGDGKTCSDVGYTKTFAKTVKKDELLQAYTRAYKAHYARMTKPRKKAANMSREEFEAWYKEAKEGLELARQGKIDAEEYKSWLKK
ncbi:DUF6076 domain-containing protein [Frisingicoccus sp.]|uniref:DUF6076 domain-containing protein n=1 Tax=Frisingicoccus sp. TaxID=1918627 RepID=UPI003AB31BA7